MMLLLEVFVLLRPAQCVLQRLLVNRIHMVDYLSYIVHK